jgi:hypothetical protein
MEDNRCCGSGTCIINADGLCWCGQRWDGQRMSPPAPLAARMGSELAPAEETKASQTAARVESVPEPSPLGNR